MLKSNRHYTIRLRLSFGDYYFSRAEGYYNSTYFFTQKLSSVRKWKTVKGASEIIKSLTNSDGTIVVPLGTDISKLPVDIQNNSYYVAKKYYFRISRLNAIRVDNKYLDKEQEKLFIEMNELNISIKDIINSNPINISFLQTQQYKLIEKANKYNDISKEKAKNHINSNFELSLVDVSFNFRTLKIKNLAEINKEEELEEK